MHIATAHTEVRKRLRDPALFADNGRTTIVYAVCRGQRIAAADIRFAK